MNGETINVKIRNPSGPQWTEIIFLHRRNTWTFLWTWFLSAKAVGFTRWILVDPCLWMNIKYTLYILIICIYIHTYIYLQNKHVYLIVHMYIYIYTYGSHPPGPTWGGGECITYRVWCWIHSKTCSENTSNSVFYSHLIGFALMLFIL